MNPADTQKLQSYIEARSVIEPNSGCWLWLLSDGSHGYPQGSLPSVTGERVSLAHRLSYLAYNGPIPMQHEVDHLCRNRCCVNPAHLEATTKHANRARQHGKSVPANYTAEDGCSTCGAEYRKIYGKLVCPECVKLSKQKYNQRNRKRA